MIACGKCGRQNPDWCNHCIGCGTRLDDSGRRAAVQAEAEHIAYLLRQLTPWQERGLLTADSVNALRREYTARREAMLGIARGAMPPDPVQKAAAAPSRPAPPPVHPPVPAPVPASVPPMETPPAREPAATSVPPAAAARPVVRPQPARPSWVAEFLEEHWMKLLSGIAALLILTGMRQVLGWEWVGAVARSLIPLLPIGLAAGTLRAGLRARDPQSIGGFAASAVGIALTPFSLFSVNKHWLGSALPDPVTLAGGAAAGTAVAVWVLRAARDERLLHIVLAGLGATLFTLLRVAWPSPVLAPSPLWLYGGAFLGLSLALLGCARHTDESGVRVRLVLWGHLSACSVPVWIASSSLTVGALASDTAVLLAAGAVLYAVSAQWFGSSAMSYGGGALAAAAAAAIMGRHGTFDAYSVGLAAAALGGLALALSVANSQPDESGGGAEIADSYGLMAAIAAAVAGVALLARVLGAVSGMGMPLTGADWARGIALGALCAGLYAALAVRTKRADVLYASAAAAAFAAGLGADRAAANAGLIGRPLLAHDLLAFVAVALAGGLLARRVRVTDADGTERSAAAPYLHAAGFALIIAISELVATGLIRDASRGVTGALVVAGALGAAGAALTRHEAPRTIAQGWLVCAMAAVTSAAGLVAPPLLGPAGLEGPASSAAAVIAMAWVWFAIGEALRRRVAGSPWTGPVSGTGVAAALAGSAWAVHGHNWNVPAVLGLLVFAAALPIARCLAEQRKDLLVGSFAVTLAGFLISSSLWHPLSQQPTSVRDAWFAEGFGIAAAAAFIVYGLRLCSRRGVWFGFVSALFAAGFPKGPGMSVVPGITGVEIAAAVSAAAAAFGLGLAARRFADEWLAATCAVLACAAYGIAISFFVHASGWGVALVALPAVCAVAAGGEVLERKGLVGFRTPFQGVAIVVALGALLAASEPGVDQPVTRTVALIAYALACAAFSLAGRHLRALGAASATLMALAWLLAEPTHLAPSTALRLWWLLAGGSFCACGLYGRVAWSTNSRAFAGGAALTFCGGWFALTTGIWHVVHTHEALAMLPALAGVYVVGVLLDRAAKPAFAVPLLVVSASVGVLSVLLSLGVSVDRTPPTILAHAASLVAYSMVCSALAQMDRPERDGLGYASISLLALAWLVGWPGDGASVLVHRTWWLLAGGAVLSAAAYARLSWDAPNHAFGASCAAAALAAWHAIFVGCLHVAPGFVALLDLPVFCGLTAVSVLLNRSERAEFATSVRVVVAVAASAALAISVGANGAESGHVLRVGTLIAYALACGGAALGTRTYARRLTLTSGVLLGLAWVLGAPIDASGPVAAAAWALLVVGSAAGAAIYAYLAWSAEDDVCGPAAAIAAHAAWLALMHGVLRVPPHWLALAMLPGFAATYLAGTVIPRQRQEALGRPLRGLAATLSFPAMGFCVLGGLPDWPLHAWLAAWTLAAYAACWLAVAWRERGPAAALVGAIVASVATGLALAGSGLIGPHWAAAFGAAMAVWVPLARALEIQEGRSDQAAGLYSFSGFAAALAAVAAVVTSGRIDAGMFVLLTIAISGSVYLGLYVLGRGAAWAHAGVGCYLLAYSLLLHDKVGMHVAVLDLYMIPLGLYLVLVGHLAGRRGADDRAGMLWWLGLLVSLTPTFLAFFQERDAPAGAIHAALLLAECIGAIAWGIANRIRAFVFVGAFFMVAYALVLGSGAAHEPWAPVMAIAIGVALLALVLYLSANQDAVRRWVNAATRELGAWR